MKSTYVLLAVMLATPLPALAGGPAPFSWLDQQDQQDQRPIGPPRAGRGPGPDGAMRSPERMFDRVDANRDGSISRSEFVAAHRRMTQRRQDRQAGGAFRGDRRP